MVYVLLNDLGYYVDISSVIKYFKYILLWSYGWLHSNMIFGLV